MKMMTKRLKTKKQFVFNAVLDGECEQIIVKSGIEVEVFCVIKDRLMASGEAVVVKFTDKNSPEELYDTVKVIDESLIDWERINMVIDYKKLYSALLVKYQAGTITDSDLKKLQLLHQWYKNETEGDLT